MTGEVLLGTCSWTDPSLIQCGRFYPPQVSTPEERLRFYGSQFPMVEVDSTFYGLPSQRNSALWVERTPDHFLFHVKAFSLFTQHPTPVRALPREVREALPPQVQAKERVYARDVPQVLLARVWHMFQEALLPLDSAGKLGLILFQFPPWFLPSNESRAYILECRERLPQYRLAAEFRNASWLNDKNRERTMAFLREHGLAFVCVDEPQGFSSSVPPLAQATSDQAYVRFHGRNAKTWQARVRTTAERFDWWYSDDELQEWVPRIRFLQELAGRVHVLFNTNSQDQGPVNARRLDALLQEAPQDNVH